MELKEKYEALKKECRILEMKKNDMGKQLTIETINAIKAELKENDLLTIVYNGRNIEPDTISAKYQSEYLNHIYICNDDGTCNVNFELKELALFVGCEENSNFIGSIKQIYLNGKNIID